MAKTKIAVLVSGGVTTLVFLMLFGLGGLLLIFFGLKPKKRYGY